MRLAASEAQLKLAQEQVALLDATLSAARAEGAEAREREAALQAQLAEALAAREACAAAAAEAAEEREGELRAQLAEEREARRVAEAEGSGAAASAAAAVAEAAADRDAAAAAAEQLRARVAELEEKLATAAASAAPDAVASRSEEPGDASVGPSGAQQARETPPPQEPPPPPQQQQLQVLQVGISRDEVASLRRLWQSKLEAVSAEAVALSGTVAELQEQVAAAQQGAAKAPCRAAAVTSSVLHHNSHLACARSQLGSLPRRPRRQGGRGEAPHEAADGHPGGRALARG